MARFSIGDNSGTGTATLDTSSNNYSITSTDDLFIGRPTGSSRSGHLIANASTIDVADNLEIWLGGNYEYF